MTISVAMATYNGERYLQEQLDSLARQTRLPDELVITDDGSTDRTVDIAESFARASPFPVRIHRNPGNLGYPDNFLKAASLCTGDWIAFCDQDDVWLPEKLATVSAAAKHPGCVLVVHSAELVEASLEPTGNRWPDIRHDRVAEPLHNRIWWVPAGFVSTFASSLIKDIPWHDRPRDFNYPERAMAHDEWVYLLANASGRTAYIARPLALYRRHGDTVTGRYDRRGWKPALEGAMKADAEHYHFLAEIAEEYRTLFADLSSDNRRDHSKPQLRAAAEYYAKVARWHHERAALHGTNSFIDAVRRVARLVGTGAYAGLGGRGLGYRALAKDLVWSTSRMVPAPLWPRLGSR